MRLQNGGLLRGTITESIPGEYVSIVLVTGEIRKIPMANVKYTGPADAEPAAQPPASATGTRQQPSSFATSGAPQSADGTRPFLTVRGREARISFRSRTPNTTFYVKTASATAGADGYQVEASGYTRICSAPCEATLPEGSYTFALTTDDKAPVAAKPIHVSGSQTVHGQLERKRGVRAGGWVIFGAGLVVGTSLLTAGLIADCETETDDDEFTYDYESPTGCTNTGLVVAGAVTAGVGAVVGLVMALQRDDARITLAPGNVGALRERRSHFANLSGAPAERTYNPGFVLRATF